MITILNVLTYLALVLGIILNITGFVLLVKDSKTGGRQRGLLINLTVATVFYSLTCIIGLVYSTFEDDVVESSLGYKLKHLIGIAAMPMYCYMLIITLDQFLSCAFVYRYRASFSNSRLQKLLIAVWMFTIILTIASFVADYAVFKIAVDLNFWLALDWTFFAVLIISYGGIFVKLNRRKRLDANNAAVINSERKRQNKQFFKVSGSIVVSYFLFFTIPSLISIFTGKKYMEMVNFLYTIPTITTALIYILYRKDVRTNMCCKKKIDNARQSSSYVIRNEEKVAETAL